MIFLEQSNGNIIKTFKYGNVTVEVSNECFRKTPEEKEMVDRDIAKAAWRIIKSARARGIDI